LLGAKLICVDSEKLSVVRVLPVITDRKKQSREGICRPVKKAWAFGKAVAESKFQHLCFVPCCKPDDRILKFIIRFCSLLSRSASLAAVKPGRYTPGSSFHPTFG